MAGHQPLDVPRMVPKPRQPPPRPQAQPRDGQRGPKACDAKLQVRGHFSGPGALCILVEVSGAGQVHVERAAKAGLRGKGSMVTRLARVLPAAPARPPAPRAHASPSIQAAPTSIWETIWESVWQDRLQDKGSGRLDGHSEP